MSTIDTSGASCPSASRDQPQRSLLRSARGTRCVRRRLRRAHERQALARHRAEGAARADQPRAPRRLRLRSQHRRRRRHPAADARRVLPRGGAVLAARCRRVRRRPGVPAARHRRPRGGQGAHRPHRRGRRPASPRVARRADRRLAGRTERAGGRALLRAGVHRRRRRHHRRRRRPALRAQALRDPEAGREGGRDAEDQRAGQAHVLHRQPVVEDADLQGHAHRPAAPADVSRSVGPAARLGAGARAPAVQHQHVPVVAAGAPLPADRAQRRDQHAARQHQLDARARGAAQEPGARRRPQEGAAGDQGRGQRHRHLRQRARAADDGGPVAAARRADDDSRAVERQRPDGRGSEGVLRVPLVADGAVGRPGVDCVHRRHGDWRGARPQRAAAVALLRHQGRPGGDGLGSGGAGHPGR